MKLPRPPLWLFLAIVIPRMLFLIPAFSAPERFLQSDAEAYQILAHNLWDHSEFSFSQGAPWTPEAKYMPGYPLFAGFFTTFLHAPISWLIAIHLFINLLTVYALWVWARRISSPEKANLAALVFGLDIVTLSHVPILIAENLFLCLETAGAIQTWRCLEHPSRTSWLWAGLLWGMACMIKPISIFLPLGFFLLFMLFKKRPWGFLLAAYLLPGFWCLRNYHMTNHFGFSNQGGVDLLLYTAADLEATNTHRMLEETQKQLVLRIDSAHPQGYANMSEKSTVYGKAAVMILKEHPWLLMRHAVISISRMLAGTGFEIPLNQWGLAAPYQGITTLSQPRGSGTLSLLRRYPWLIPIQLFYWLVLCILYLAFAQGARALWKMGKKPEALYLLCGVLYFMAILALHVGYYRFRIPLMPFLVAGAACARPTRRV